MFNKNRLKFAILKENDSEIVIVKPAGIASQLTSDPNHTSIISQIRDAYSQNLQPELSHRLDRITRGLMIIPLTKEAVSFHNKNIREKRWEKYYLAKVKCDKNNDIYKALGIQKAYLKRKGKKAEAVRSGGKPSFLEILYITPVPGKENEYHIFLKLLTGRFHQIRVMLANMGLPLVDDFLYGTKVKKGGNNFYLEAIILKYISFDTGLVEVAFYKDDPDRKKVSRKMKLYIEQTVKELNMD
ncbi:MAG: RNA pseudouridine synthase [bacterium]|nr:RNA pseudouridine synthase [bacterium]